MVALTFGARSTVLSGVIEMAQGLMRLNSEARSIASAMQNTGASPTTNIKPVVDEILDDGANTGAAIALLDELVTELQRIKTDGEFQTPASEYGGP